jgi:hypothetical protein
MKPGHPALAIMIGGGHKPPAGHDEGDEYEHEGGDEKTSAAKMILDAIKKNDHELLCEGLEAFFDAAESTEHDEEAAKESEHAEDDEQEDHEMIGGRGS